MVDTCLSNTHTHAHTPCVSGVITRPYSTPATTPMGVVGTDRCSASDPNVNAHLARQWPPRHRQYTSDGDRPDLPWLRRSCSLHDTVSVCAVPPAYQITRDRLNVERSWRAAVVWYNRNSVSECRHAALTKVTSPGHLPGRALPSPPPPPHRTVAEAAIFFMRR